MQLENDALIRDSRAFFNILTTLSAKGDWVANIRQKIPKMKLFV